MNSPYMGNFEVTQEYKGNAHDGLDLVGLESKEVHSTVNGCVVFASWENPDNTKQGFGQYVVIRDSAGLLHHYGHLSTIKVKVGDTVERGQLIGLCGNTGRSTGPHLHFEVIVNGSTKNPINYLK